MLPFSSLYFAYSLFDMSARVALPVDGGTLTPPVGEVIRWKEMGKGTDKRKLSLQRRFSLFIISLQFVFIFRIQAVPSNLLLG